MTATLADPLQVASVCLDEVRESIVGCGDAGALDLLDQVEVLSRKAHGLMLDLVAEVEWRNLAGAAGFATTARLLAGRLTLSQAEARARVAHAEQVGVRRALTGEPLPPRLAGTAAGLAAGEIGPGQLVVIAETMAAVPATVGAADREWAEAHLARHARRFDPSALRKIGAHLLAHLDPDGPEPGDDTRPAPAGELRLRDRRGGGLGFEGRLDAEHGPAFRELIEQLAAPRPAADGIPDQRSTPERQADALVELCGLARAAQAAPTAAGEPPHLTVTLDYDTLRTALGVGILDYGAHLPASDARRWACDAKIIPVVLGGDSEPLDVGRAMRTVPLGIRRALVARDRGCAFPGCDRPPALCQAHHVRHWVDHGPSSLANCVLLCEPHHRHVHQTGWEILIRPGHVEFIPPAILDPDRRPLRNPLRC